MNEISRRRKFTRKNFGELQNQLSQARKICGEKACVYATGSYGRQEAGADSDLDLFIVGLPASKEKPLHPCPGSGQDERELSQLDEICLKAELIEATKRLKLPEFDGDGEYLRHYTGQSLVELLGKPNDDARNTFTASGTVLTLGAPD